MKKNKQLKPIVNAPSLTKIRNMTFTVRTEKPMQTLAFCRTCNYYVISPSLIRKHRRLGHTLDAEIRVERSKVFDDVLEAVMEGVGEQRDWRGVRNGAFDESDRLLYKQPSNVGTGSVNWTNSFTPLFKMWRAFLVSWPTGVSCPTL